jgi:response regulator RpfG family c-di-GMP phosphodiesterase
MKRILFVDDEPNVLSAIHRQLYDRFQVETATGPVAGLAALEKNWPDYSVVVADMGMPGMTGIEFLAHASQIAPQVVRVMLTGYVNQATAVEAINQGKIFRFLSKPCSTEKLVEALDAAVAQHNLILAEHELLENTLGGCLKVLSEILALAEPKTFGLAESLRDAIRLLAASMSVTPTWDLEAAALLSQIGYVTIPPELILKARQAQPLTDRERDVFTRIPAIGSSLLSQIPRLEGVARIILYQHKRFDGGGFPEDSVAGESIPLGSRMLKVLVDLSRLDASGSKRPAALAQMRERAGWYDPRLLEAVEKQAPVLGGKSAGAGGSATAVNFANLRVGHILYSNLETKGGMLLLAAGNRITPMLMHRLRNFSSLYGIQEPIYIDDSSAALFSHPSPNAALKPA